MHRSSNCAVVAESVIWFLSALGSSNAGHIPRYCAIPHDGTDGVAGLNRCHAPDHVTIGPGQQRESAIQDGSGVKTQECRLLHVQVGECAGQNCPGARLNASLDLIQACSPLGELDARQLPHVALHTGQVDSLPVQHPHAGAMQLDRDQPAVRLRVPEVAVNRRRQPRIEFRQARTPLGKYQGWTRSIEALGELLKVRPLLVKDMHE